MTSGLITAASQLYAGYNDGAYPDAGSDVVWSGPGTGDGGQYGDGGAFSSSQGDYNVGIGTYTDGSGDYPGGYYD